MLETTSLLLDLLLQLIESRLLKSDDGLILTESVHLLDSLNFTTLSYYILEAFLISVREGLEEAQETVKVGLA